MRASLEVHAGLAVVLVAVGMGLMSACSGPTAPAGTSSTAAAPAAPASGSAALLAPGSQYDTTHVYVQPGTIDVFVKSWLATFGGSSSAQSVVDVTPTPSETKSQLVLSSVGTLSVFDFQTPIPYPFGVERTGLLVSDFDAGVGDAHAAGADLVVSPFPDPIGRDALVQFPGGINTQLYWHTKAPSYAPLASVPENRVYLSADAVAGFLKSYLAFTGGKIDSDNPQADSAELGTAGGTFRRVSIESAFGKALVMVTDGHLPYPFGRELTGYAVADVPATVAKATAAGAKTLWGPTQAGGRNTALVQFPGGYIAEIHSGQ